MPGHQPSQLGRATIDKATQAPPLKVGSETTAVDRWQGGDQGVGPPIGPSRGGGGGVQAKLTARQCGITAAAGTRAKAAGSVMMTRQSGATRRVGDGDQGHAGTAERGIDPRERRSKAPPLSSGPNTPPTPTTAPARAHRKISTAQFGTGGWNEGCGGGSEKETVGAERWDGERTGWEWLQGGGEGRQ